MNIKKFEVPLNLMVQFAEIMEEHEIDNTVQGVSVFGDIEILVKYGQEQDAVIKGFSDIINDHCRNRNEAIAIRTLKKLVKLSKLQELKIK